MPCMACTGIFCFVLPCFSGSEDANEKFREQSQCARFWHRLGLESCWGFGVSEPCPTVRHTAFPRYSGSSQHLWLCLVIRFIPTAIHHPFRSVLPCMPLVVPKMLFRKHLCVCFWHRLGLESCWGSLVSHACPTQPFHEELASAWGLNPGGMRCFTTMPHSAPQGFSMVLAGPSRHLMALPSMFCMPCFALFGLYFLAVPKMLFREHLCARFWHRLGLESLLGIRCFATMPHRAPQHFSTVLRFIQASLALPSMPCMPCKLLCIALYVAVPKMLFREHLRARFWHRLGLESCWGSGVSQPCPALYLAVAHASGTALGLNPAGDPVFRNHARPCSHRAFPRYSGSSKHLSRPAFYALYGLYICFVLPCFSGSEDAISRASMRTLLAPPWAWILLGIRCFGTMPHRASHGFSTVLGFISTFYGFAPQPHTTLSGVYCLVCL